MILIKKETIPGRVALCDMHRSNILINYAMYNYDCVTIIDFEGTDSIQDNLSNTNCA